MSQVNCRCGETITVQSGPGPERIDCPKCGARIRLRRKPSGPGTTASPDEPDDGYIRFYCPCGRRLKVRAAGVQRAGKCPECGRMVPVPGSGQPGAGAGAGARAGRRADPDARTQDLDAHDLAMLREWSERHTGRRPAAADGPDANATPTGVPHIRVGPPPFVDPPATSMVSFEAGLRVCPRCGKPVHISATTCRECGAAVPRR